MSCCGLSDFMEDFNFYFWKDMENMPTADQLKKAKSDWRAGSTGWEAVKIAEERIEEAARKAAEEPLINIGGNNYAHEGSDLALRFGSKP